jgi:phage FluMu gp28-like protein
MGDRNYCVVQVSCDVVLKPTIKGEAVNALLKKSDIETALKTNPEKARREYYCEFTSDAGNEAIIRRGVITRNSETRVPLLHNDTGDKKFVITFDPARNRDNSIITVMEVYKDDDGEYKGRIVNCVNMIDISTKRKTPMQTPDQVDYLRHLILDYNGNAPKYGNIEAIMIDAGSGGAGKVIADMLMQDWVDSKGKSHPGFIDKELDKQLGTGYSSKYPNAVDKVKLMEPSKYKSIMYESAIEMTNSNLISFTAEYDNKGYLTLFVLDDKETKNVRKQIEERLKKENLSDEAYAIKLQEEMKKSSVVKTKIVQLDTYQEIALTNIDALKEELVNMRRIKRDSGKDSFELIPEKVGRLHDDRAYTYVMCSYHLQEKRLSNIRDKKRDNGSHDEILAKLIVSSGKHIDKIFG